LRSPTHRVAEEAAGRRREEHEVYLLEQGRLPATELKPLSCHLAALVFGIGWELISFLLETLSVRKIGCRPRAAVVIKPVSADGLRKTGIFEDKAGDFRRFLPQER
jgi:hypothetical protein